jgi:trypsin
LEIFLIELGIWVDAGDSGGPLTCYDDSVFGKRKPVVCGVTSHGLGCANDGYPGVYTDLSRYAMWINKTIENFQ